ncbi:hypothetical protein RRF57_008602 [Xylaria bambusicola]|uniref:Uncharacterized protein n=1 Tax=Xylaria bambusicola TaxID=326684 RepID=A0AAN7ZBI4_9PEZI
MYAYKSLRGDQRPKLDIPSTLHLAEYSLKHLRQSVNLSISEGIAIPLELQSVSVQGLLYLDHQSIVDDHEHLALGHDEPAHVVNGHSRASWLERLKAVEQLRRVYLAVSAKAPVDIAQSNCAVLSRLPELALSVFQEC